ncbi:MAG TPA: DUF4349 domain-containing protein [Candidatus Acidoferrum sp.]|nr:DUF4349 domain-containing protein [Candidatus Acidoferrum sp.]
MKKLLIFTLAAVLLLSGCSAKGSRSESTAPSSPSMENRDTAQGEFGWSDKDAQSESPKAPVSEYESITNNPDGAVTPEEEAKALSEKLIYTGQLEVESLEFDKSCQTVEELLDKVGGFIENSSISGSTYYTEDGVPKLDDRYASYRLRVPSAKFEDFMGSAGEIGNVTDRGTNVDNITAQYYDTDARLKSYQVQYDRLLALMEKAERMEDILAIENQLTQVRYQIESLETTLRGWQNQVDYSTVNITIQEVVRYSPAAKLSFFQRLANAFSGSLRSFGYWLENSSFSVIYALPYLVLLAVLWLVLRKFFPKLRLRIKKPTILTKKDRDAGLPKDSLEE